VSFTAPVSNGGRAITLYTVTSNPEYITAICSGSPIIIAGLTNGTAYTFTVTATNSAGSSSPSAALNSVTLDYTTSIACPCGYSCYASYYRDDSFRDVVEEEGIID
jgi:hypothetical protein